MHAPLRLPRSGRKRAALTYCVTYTLGCLTKHFNSFWILAGGRVLCGVATSLLFSAFESWLVAEHNKVVVARCAAREQIQRLAAWQQRPPPSASGPVDLMGRHVAARLFGTYFDAGAASGLLPAWPNSMAATAIAASRFFSHTRHTQFRMRSEGITPTGSATPSARPCSWATA